MACSLAPVRASSAHVFADPGALVLRATVADDVAAAFGDSLVTGAAVSSPSASRAWLIGRAGAAANVRTAALGLVRPIRLGGVGTAVDALGAISVADFAASAGSGSGLVPPGCTS